MDWDAIRKEYETSDITLKALADKHDIKLGTMKSRKSRDGWTRVATSKNATKGKKVATSKKKDATKSPKKKRSGNPNPLNQFSERNQAARKHGLFSRHMPKETLEIMEKVAGADPVDLVWMQIQIQFAAIIRAQEIMFVESKNEMIKELKKTKFEVVPGDDGPKQVPTEIEYEFQFAWDRHATFLNAQTKALTELRGSIRQFEEMASQDDERRLKLEHMRLNIEKTKAELEKITSGDDDKPIEIVIKRKGEQA